MEYKGTDSPPPYQQLPSPPPGYQVTPSPALPYQQMSSPGTSTSAVIAPRVMFREFPVQVTCGNCGQAVTTTVIKSNGTCAYLSAVAVFLVCFPFFWVPLLMDSCKDYRHVCPSCNALLGTYKKI